MPHPPLHGVDASAIDSLPVADGCGTSNESVEFAAVVRRIVSRFAAHAGQATGSTIANSPVATATWIESRKAAHARNGPR